MVISRKGKFTADCDGWSLFGAFPDQDAYVRVSVSLFRVNPDASLTLVDTGGDCVVINAANNFLIDTGDIWNQELTAGMYRATIVEEIFFGYQSEPPVGTPADRTFAGKTSDFFCSTVDARTPGYWKNHAGAWPVDSLSIGGVELSQSELLVIFDTPVHGDITIILAKHLIAAKLNLLSGVDGASLGSTIDDADAYLVLNPIGSRPSGATKQAGVVLKDALDAFNNG